jgi:uncharacterized Zn-finger protein
MVNNMTKPVNISVKLQAQDLPLACPLPNMAVWNMHPKVYLALDEDHQATCPYCETTYYLQDEDSKVTE